MEIPQKTFGCSKATSSNPTSTSKSTVKLSTRPQPSNSTTKSSKSTTTHQQSPSQTDWVHLNKDQIADQQFHDDSEWDFCNDIDKHRVKKLESAKSWNQTNRERVLEMERVRKIRREKEAKEKNARDRELEALKTERVGRERESCWAMNEVD